MNCVPGAMFCDGRNAREDNNNDDFIFMDFENLSYTVGSGTRKREKKKILHDLNGRFPPGKLIGILGPSGAGKSTLLNILSGFESRGVEGCVSINGTERNLKDFKKVSCYITQDNDLHNLLTVEENMKFAADLKLGPVDVEKKNSIINDILRTFGLYEIRKTQTSRISGGQMKRLSVCLELLSDPLVVFLDEPTTGLDSYATHQCIQYLKQLAQEGKTIVCTIHTPSAMLFKMFDQVYVLSQGRCLYQGETNSLVPFLQRIGIPCNLYHNPADYVIELASGDYGEDKIDLMVRESQNDWRMNMKERQILRSQMDKSVRNGEIKNKISTYERTNWYELKCLMAREYVKLKRNISLTHLRIVASIVNSLFIGILYYKLGGDASKIWFNYNLVLAVIANIILGGVMLTILVFPTEMHVLRKENFNGYYSLRNYYVCITLLDLPLSIACCLISNLIVYYLTDQPMESHRVAMFLVLGFLIAIVAQSVGLFIGASLNIKNGVFVGSYIHIPIMLLSGFGLTFADIPKGFYWLSYCSYLRYGVNGMVGSIFGYNRTKLSCPDDEYCYYTRGDKFLEDMGVESNDFWMNCLVLMLFYIVIRTASFYSMKSRMVNIN